jgi:hypothetical protein
MGLEGCIGHLKGPLKHKRHCWTGCLPYRHPTNAPPELWPRIPCYGVSCGCVMVLTAQCMHNNTLTALQSPIHTPNRVPMLKKRWCIAY